MASIVVTGDTSGAITIAAPAVAGTNTLTLPASTGTLVVTGGAQTIEFADGSAAAPSITNSGDTNTGMFFPAADTIAFTEGGTESMRIDSAGRVGIGTTTPNIYSVSGSLLTVSSSTNYSYLALAGSSGNGGAIDFGNQTIRHAEIASLNGSALAFYTNGTDSGTGLSERMRITSTGLFGFNASDPATFSSGVAQAVIERTSAGNNTVALALVNRSGTTNTSVSLDFNPNTNIALAQIRAFRTDASFGGGTDLRFLNYDGSALAERMRITSGGNLLIGTTSTLMDSEAVLVATNTGVTQNIRCAASSGGAGIHVQRSASTGNLLYFTYTTGATYVGQINTNGTSTSYSSASDYRLKDEITPMTAALETVAQLKPVKFKFKSDGSNGQGFIAHELQAVVPDAVVGEKDAVDAEGKPIYQGVDTSFLVATLTAAIQELNAKVEAQAVRIAELEGAK